MFFTITRNHNTHLFEEALRTSLYEGIYGMALQRHIAKDLLTAPEEQLSVLSAAMPLWLSVDG